MISIPPVFAAATLIFAGLSSIAFAQSSGAAISMSDDGAIEVTGLVQPGAGLALPETCTDLDTPAHTVVCMADRFLDTLSDDQRGKVQLPMTAENATAWSNLPCGANCRVGLALADLNETQQKAALGLIRAASSAGGFDELTQIMMADDILTLAQEAGIATEMAPPPDAGDQPEGMQPPEGMGGPGGGLAYSSEAYFIAILGAPSTSEAWHLQFGGHHLGTLHTYSGGQETSATPNFIGVEPKVWTNDGVTYSPLTDDRDALVAMLASLTADHQAEAKLDAAFSDVLLGPGKDGQFPAEKQGLRVGDLSADQKALVMEAIRAWVGDTADTSAERIMADYEVELDETYIAFSGGTSLDQHADYVRIDGPRVWIEFVCQDGVIFGDQIHYHTIWRDHETDYGAIYDF
ncbi:DUF3500 domain-containing protein [Notoacmeibacter sp. MSK16QG-6]|uniref:DUF3500 domain-containing protein n=1 Tax=Notoacmeibacter sp. MSK16QG-6 TaxID=2957982 RepID=UPI0020A0C4DF|nr:DUF3500 domain-containing protein [Notoacmeibacter sp. MSK16QG-6]MCP1200516.1 DUF3500 domain-containing protein [Notoacmeibacter sp. MSK16QG-6]